VEQETSNRAGDNEERDGTAKFALVVAHSGFNATR